MTPEYRRTQVTASDPREREPVLYVYPDGIFTKSQKKRRIDMIFHGWDHLKKDPPKEKRLPMRSKVLLTVSPRSP